MQQNLAPNLDEADEGSLVGVLRSWIRSFIRESLDDMLPAAVVSYDDANNRAVLKPLIMVGTSDGRKVSRGSIPNIPVFRFGGGGFFMRFPIKPGDFGWLKANDRDVSLMFQRGGREDWPNTERLHSFSDAMFFPDTLRGWEIAGENADAFVLQSMDGSTCLALHAGKIVVTGGEFVIDTDALTVKCPAHFERAIRADQGMDHEDVRIDKSHGHTNVQNGPGTSGGVSG